MDGPVVFVIDDDMEFSNSVRWLLESVNLETRLYSSAQSFLAEIPPERTGCLLTDVRMPGMSGLELQKEVVERGLNLPVIVMTAHGDIDMAVRAMKNQAFDFIQKPFNDQVFLDLIQKAINVSLAHDSERRREQEAADRLESLTAREQEVLDLVVEGHTNKSIAENLSISEKTVEVHRARVMEKTGAGSLAELVKLVISSGDT